LHQQNSGKWKCKVCKGAHKAFNLKCLRKQREKERVRMAAMMRLTYHAVKVTGAGRAMPPPIFLKKVVTFTHAANKGTK